MNAQEKNIIDQTVDIWNSFLQLSQYSRHDNDEMCFHIHAIQRIIMSREAVRGNPDIFRITGDLQLNEYARLTGYSESEIKGKSRKGDLPTVRAYFWYRLKKSGWHIFRIAGQFGRNHSTIIHGIRTIENLISANDPVVRRLQAII